MAASRPKARWLLGHRWAAYALVALLLLSLAGCGFRPIYGAAAKGLNGDGGQESSQPGGVKTALAQVKIGLIPDRAGQQLRNQLLDLINPAGEPAHPSYRLTISLITEKTALATRSDASVSLSRLRTTLRYRLEAVDQTTVAVAVEAAPAPLSPTAPAASNGAPAASNATQNQPPLDQGTLSASTSFNVLDSLYASKAAEDDALARSLKDLAYQLTDAVAIALQQPRSAANTQPESPQP